MQKPLLKLRKTEIGKNNTDAIASEVKETTMKYKTRQYRTIPVVPRVHRAVQHSLAQTLFQCMEKYSFLILLFTSGSFADDAQYILEEVERVMKGGGARVAR